MPRTVVGNAVGLVKAMLNYHGGRREIVHQYLFEMLRRLTPVIGVGDDGIQYYVSTRDQVGLHMFVHGNFELEVMTAAVGMIDELSGRSCLEGKTFVDIGANVGMSCIPAVKLFGAAGAIAFEPEPRNFQLLRCNLVSNGVDAQVRAVRAAVSDSSATGLLELADTNWGDHRVVSTRGAGDERFRESSRERLEVPFTRLDDAMDELDADWSEVGIVWMDTQGHEGHVLRGAPSLLESSVPVVLEYWPYGLRRAGGLSVLHDLVAANYERIVDVRASMDHGELKDLPAADIHLLEAQYTADYTDLILIG